MRQHTLDDLTRQHAGTQVRDLGDGRIKTVSTFDEKNGPSGEPTLLVTFTDGTWAYTSMTERS